MKLRFRSRRGEDPNRSEGDPGAPGAPDIREESRRIAARRRSERRAERARRKGERRAKRGRRKSERSAERADVREESRQIAARQRAEQRAERADSIVVGLRGAGSGARRSLGGVGDALLAFLSRIASPLVGALFGLFRLGVLALLAVTRRGERVLRWLSARVQPAGAGLLRWLMVVVTPVRTYALVLTAAAIFLGVSQFLHYHGVEVGARYYEGKVGQVVAAPLTDLEVTGSAHLWVLLPVSVVALVLIALTVRGRWQLGRVIAGLGLLGLVISVAADVPQGLDAGRAGSAYASTDAELLEGFWIQVCCCALLAIFGPLLGARVRERRSERRAARRRRMRRPLQPSPGDGTELGSAGGARA